MDSSRTIGNSLAKSSSVTTPANAATVRTSCDNSQGSSSGSNRRAPIQSTNNETPQFTPEQLSLPFAPIQAILPPLPLSSSSTQSIKFDLTLPPSTTPSPPPQRRSQASNNTSFNRLKETVLRCQERKRKREEEETGCQSTTNSNVPVNSATSEQSESDGSSQPKIRKKDDESVQQGTSAQSLTTSIEVVCPNGSVHRRYIPNINHNNNQQITGLARQHEPRNCHFCSPSSVPNTGNIPRNNSLPTPRLYQPRPPQEQLYLLRQAQAMMNTQFVPVVLPVQTNQVRVPNQVRAQNPIRPQNQAPVQNHPRPYDTADIRHRLEIEIHRRAQESFRQNHLQQLQNQINNFIPNLARSLPPGFLLLPSTVPGLVGDVSFMLNYLQQTTDTFIRDRIALDRHYMFGGPPDDIPIGANSHEIERNTRKTLYQKKEDTPEGEEERCTVCLTEFEIGKEVRILQCKHYFHTECIDKWLFYNKKCPVCRMEVDKKRLIFPPAPPIPNPSTFEFLH